MARKVVVDKVEEVLSAGFTAAPIFGENEERTPPADGSSYVIVQYPFARSFQASLGSPGSNVWRDEGAFRIVLHVERGRSLATARGWADDIADLFRGKDFTVMQTQAPTPPVTDDRSPNGSYWVMSLSVPYTHDYFA